MKKHYSPSDHEMAQELWTIAVADLVKKSQAKCEKDRKIMLDVFSYEVSFQDPSSGEFMQWLCRSGPVQISDIIK